MEIVTVGCIAFAILVICWIGVSWECYRTDEDRSRMQFASEMVLSVLLLSCDFLFYALNIAELLRHNS